MLYQLLLSLKVEINFFPRQLEWLRLSALLLKFAKRRYDRAFMGTKMIHNIIPTFY